MNSFEQQSLPPSDHQLSSELARFSLPHAFDESYRKFAWTDAVCLVFFVIGLVGFYRPGPITPPKKAEAPQVVAEIKELRPDLIEEPPPMVQTAEEPLPAESLPEPAAAEPPAPIPVAEMSPSVQFAIPVEGPTILVPVERAAAPSTAQAKASPQTAVQSKGTSSTQGTYFRQSYGRGGMVKPKYPRDLELKGVSGEVLLLVTVDQEGHLVDAELEKRSGYREFDQEALRAARHPATRFNVPSAGKYSIPVLFDMTGKYQEEPK